MLKNKWGIFSDKSGTFLLTITTEWDDSLFERFVEKVKVLSRDEVEFELKFGLRLKERID